jgi:uncharacterized membrane protein
MASPTPSDPGPDLPPGADPGAVRRAHRYWRRGDEPEFGRILYFSDAVYAIALTLLALDLRVTTLSGDPSAPSSMLAALDDLLPELVAFGVGFALLANYWLAHHDFMSRVAAVDSRLITTNLVYLAFVALLPFPTSMIGEFESNPVSGVAFAANLAIISLLETMMLAHAQRAGLLRARLAERRYRAELLASLQPAVMFIVTIPLAFISTTLMLVSWLVVGPVAGRMVSRRARRSGSPA